MADAKVNAPQANLSQVLNLDERKRLIAALNQMETVIERASKKALNDTVAQGYRDELANLKALRDKLQNNQLF